jgi:hypothetical protein
MGLGTFSTVLIVFALVLLFFSLRPRVIIHCYEKTEEQKKAVTYHEPSAEDEERRMSDYYLGTALY